jgi:hypothetical protein
MIKRFTQILLLVVSLGLLAFPGFSQENQPLSSRQPVVNGRARATLGSWRVVLVFQRGRWHRQRRWVCDRDDWRARRHYYWRTRRDYGQARRWRWETRRERWGDRRERWQGRWGRDG